MSNGYKPDVIRNKSLLLINERQRGRSKRAPAGHSVDAVLKPEEQNLAATPKALIDIQRAAGNYRYSNPWINLKFRDGDWERDFRKSWDDDALIVFKIWMLIFCSYAMIASVTDHFRFDEDKANTTLLYVRIPSALTAFGSFLVTGTNWFRNVHYMRYFGITLLLQSGLLGFAAITTMSDREQLIMPVASMLTVVMGYTAFRLRLQWAIIVGVSSQIICNIVAILGIALGYTNAMEDEWRSLVFNVPFLAFNIVGYIAAYNIEKIDRESFLRTREYLQECALSEYESQRGEFLLTNILPRRIVKRLKVVPNISERYESVTVVFLCIENLVDIASKMSVEYSIAFMNDLFEVCDRRAEQFGCQKVKTINDKYMAVCGAPDARNDHAAAMADMILAIFNDFKQIQERSTFNKRYCFTVRAGMSSGPIVGGVIGRRKFCWDIWGDTVNTASRMEYPKYGKVESGRVRLPHQTYELLRNTHQCTFNGELSVKGKGMLKTYLLDKRFDNTEMKTFVTSYDVISERKRAEELENQVNIEIDDDDDNNNNNKEEEVDDEDDMGIQNVIAAVGAEQAQIYRDEDDEDDVVNTNDGKKQYNRKNTPKGAAADRLMVSLGSASSTVRMRAETVPTSPSSQSELVKPKRGWLTLKTHVAKDHQQNKRSSIKHKRYSEMIRGVKIPFSSEALKGLNTPKNVNKITELVDSTIRRKSLVAASVAPQLDMDNFVKHSATKFDLPKWEELPDEQKQNYFKYNYKHRVWARPNLRWRLLWASLLFMAMGIVNPVSASGVTDEIWWWRAAASVFILIHLLLTFAPFYNRYVSYGISTCAIVGMVSASSIAQREIESNMIGNNALQGIEFYPIIPVCFILYLGFTLFGLPAIFMVIAIICTLGWLLGECVVRECISQHETGYFFILFTLFILFATIVILRLEYQFLLQWFFEVSAKQEKSKMEIRQQEADDLLTRVVPPHVLPMITSLADMSGVAKQVHGVSILFSDVAGFTALSETMSAVKLVNWLNNFFTTFDALSERHGIEKIKTIGDAYVAVGGLVDASIITEQANNMPSPRNVSNTKTVVSGNHVNNMVNMAINLQEHLAIQAEKGKVTTLRIGIHVGSVLAGIIGKRKFQYDIFGHAVAVAEHMESSGEVGKVHLSQACKEKLDRADKLYRFVQGEDFEEVHQGKEIRFHTWFVSARGSSNIRKANRLGKRLGYEADQVGQVGVGV